MILFAAMEISLGSIITWGLSIATPSAIGGYMLRPKLNIVAEIGRGQPSDYRQSVHVTYAMPSTPANPSPSQYLKFQSPTSVAEDNALSIATYKGIYLRVKI